MLSDLEDRSLERDQGWDVESLRDEVRALGGLGQQETQSGRGTT